MAGHDCNHFLPPLLSCPRTHRYGKFGYAFGRGSYNISREQYAAAVAHVGGAALKALEADFAWLPDEPMKELLQHYTSRGGRGGGRGRGSTGMDGCMWCEGSLLS